jgi:thymidine kinase
MSASKTANLLMTAHNYELQNKKIILLKPSIDTRYVQNMITSRIGIEKKVDLLVDKDTDLSTIDVTGVHCILVDECQFLESKHVEQLREHTKTVPVICYGLRTDYCTNLFEGSKRLLELADSIEEVKTTCTFCNKKAVINAKYSLDEEGKKKIIKVMGDQVDIGSENKYMVVCWSCYNN